MKPRAVVGVVFAILFTSSVAALVLWDRVAGAQGAAGVGCEDFEGTLTGWTLDPPWDVTGEDSASGLQSLTDSPGANYADNSDVAATATFDFTMVDRPLLSFKHRYDLEDYADFGYVEVSTDGTNWRRLFFATGYSLTNWYDEEIDLSEYAYEPNVSIRFRLVTNGSTTYDGWYIDDVCVLDNAAALPYPFFDDMESATSEDNWIPSSWGRITTDGHSGTSSRTDSPDGRIVGGLESELVLAGTIDLSAAVNPQLSFWHLIPQALPWWGGCPDRGWVEVSTNRGLTWEGLPGGDYHNIAVTSWRREQFDLSAYAGLPEVLVRFRLSTPCRRSEDGWYIDDVLIDEACANVVMDPPSNITEHGMDLSWSCSTCGDFQQYEIYRSTSPGVNRLSELVATITDPSQCTYSDTGLTWPNQPYYYRAYVKDTQELVNQGSNEVQGTTLFCDSEPCEIPLGGSDDMESGDKWANTLPWELIEDLGGTLCHNGSAHCWHDSPGGTYGNNEDIALKIKLNLLAGGRPLFKFWHRHNLEDYIDWGFVEVSTDSGAHWTRLFFATGFTGGTWNEEEIDLSPYAGEVIWLRFRLWTNGSTTYDGWYIDDVSVVDNTTTLPYPFFDDMESAASEDNWISSAWGRTRLDAHSPIYSWTDSPDGRIVGGLESELVLAGTIDLSAAVNPQLSFWHLIPQALPWWGGCPDRGWVEVSTNRGLTWEGLPGGDYHNIAVTSWRREQFDLSAYAGLPEVLVRFRLSTPCRRSEDGWYIDDVRIWEEGPTPTLTGTPTGTATPTPTPTDTPTFTPTPTRPLPGTPVAVDLGRGVGRAGGKACVAATLMTNGNTVAATSNDIDFDPGLFSFSDCLINPAIGPGTPADKQCVHNGIGSGVERVGVLGTGNVNPIPDGWLYTAEFAIDPGTASGGYPLSNAPGASDPGGNDLPATGTPGEILVTTCTGDCNGSGEVTIGEVIRCVNLFLGDPLCDAEDPALSCPVADANGDGNVSIGEVVQCVNSFLGGCP